MNWNIGFKRITLVLSIACAILVASLFFQDGVRVLHHNKALLARERITMFTETVHGWSLKDEWKRAETLDEQNFLWIRWTGREFGSKSFASFLGEKTPELKKRAEELKRLAEEDGWQTTKGESLYHTPEEVWQIRHKRKISELEDKVRSDTIALFAAPVVGAVLGFCGVWAAYASLIFVVSPVFKWIVLGFSEDKQIDKQKTNNLGKSSGNR